MKEKLKEIAEITMGQSPSSSFYNDRQEGIPFLQGCTTFGRLYPTYDTWTTFFNKLAKPGDTLFTVRAPVGDVNLCQTDTAIGRGIASIRARGVDSRYLFYLLEANKGGFASSSSGTIYQSINKDKLGDVVLDVHSVADQQHIVGVIGSVDDLIELNARKIAKIMDFSRLIYSQAKAISPMKSAGEFISFTKGKQADFVNQPTGEPYLTIDVLEGSQEVSYSASGVECGEGDILMVMDGAASGRCYFGYKGFVGSTLSKIECKGIDSSVAFLALEEHEKDIQKNTTGSAIPHTDKRYVSDIEIPLIKDEFTVNRLRNLLTLLVSTRKEIRTLREEKEILMRKFF